MDFSSVNDLSAWLET
ncbi:MULTISPECIES: hypothetical protein [unclassified Coleofasciculus]|nr:MULTISPECIES: hypothetical protein [unclassified Coleofasciculus]